MDFLEGFREWLNTGAALGIVVFLWRLDRRVVRLESILERDAA